MSKIKKNIAITHTIFMFFVLSIKAINKTIKQDIVKPNDAFIIMNDQILDFTNCPKLDIFVIIKENIATNIPINVIISEYNLSCLFRNP